MDACWYRHAYPHTHTQNGSRREEKSKRKKGRIAQVLLQCKPPLLVGGFNKMLIRMWISGNCWLFILLELLTLPWLLIKHFVLISHISTLLQGWPLIMVKWARSAEQCSQEQAPPCISIIPHPRSSQGPGTKSKEPLLSVTKLFNTVISRIFFIPLPFAIGNETWWKIRCIVSHANKGSGYPYPSWLWRTVLQQWETHFLNHER